MGSRAVRVKIGGADLVFHRGAMEALDYVRRQHGSPAECRLTGDQRRIVVRYPDQPSRAGYARRGARYYYPVVAVGEAEILVRAS